MKIQMKVKAFIFPERTLVCLHIGNKINKIERVDISLGQEQKNIFLKQIFLKINNQ